MDGSAVEAGIDPMTLPLDRFCNWVYSWFAARLPAKELRAFDTRLARPGPGDLPPEWTEEGQAAAFLSAQSEFGGGD